MSAGLFTSSASTSCTTSFSPSPSMSMAPREAKWITRPVTWAGHSALGQRVTASPSGRTALVPHTGHLSGSLNFRGLPVRCSRMGATTLGDHVAGTAHPHGVAHAHVLLVHLVLVVQASRWTRSRPPTFTGSSRATGVRAAGAPHLHLDVEHLRALLLRGELPRDGPARRARARAASVCTSKSLTLFTMPSIS